MKQDITRVRKPHMAFSVNIVDDLWKELDEVSRTTGIPKTEMVREGLKLWLEQNREKSA